MTFHLLDLMACHLALAHQTQAELMGVGVLPWEIPCQCHCQELKSLVKS